MIAFESSLAKVFQGNALKVLPGFAERSFNCCVTSPPYWGLRDYGIEPTIWDDNPDCEHSFLLETVEREMRLGVNLAASEASTRGGARKAAEVPNQKFEHGFCSLCGAWRGCFGLEPTPEMYIDHAVQIFRQVRRVLRDDGTLWLNIGDSYAGSWGAQGRQGADGVMADRSVAKVRSGIKPLLHHNQIAAHPKLDRNTGSLTRTPGCKNKDLVGIPWMLAFALRADGWYLRQDIIWSKPNPMPESVTDRCTKAHEYLFLLSKSERYFYNSEAVSEACSPATHARLSQDIQGQIGSARANGGAKTNGNMKAVGRKLAAAESGTKNNDSFDRAMAIMPERRNKRSVWTVATESFSEAHFATFPRDLVRPCILAGCAPGGRVLDPFAGSGTTLQVARELQCEGWGVEMNQEYIEIAGRRLAQGVMDFQGDDNEPDQDTLAEVAEPSAASVQAPLL